MPKINVLPREIAELIAAGEVVERPASVIKEMLENAIDAGADKITVEIQRGGITYMRVTDNGCGISKEDLSHIFERFYSCNKSSNDSVGIGLALAKTIFEKQRATVEVESTLDVGTTFKIKFYKTVV